MGLPIPPVVQEFLEKKGLFVEDETPFYTSGYTEPKTQVWLGQDVVVKQISMGKDGPVGRRVHPHKALEKMWKNEYNILSSEVGGHPCIPQAHDAFKRRDLGYFIVMDRIEGTPANKLNSLEACANAYSHAADVLADIHEMRVIHCDIKEQHILYNGASFIIDFNFARKKNKRIQMGDSHEVPWCNYPPYTHSKTRVKATPEIDTYALLHSYKHVIQDHLSTIKHNPALVWSVIDPERAIRSFLEQPPTTARRVARQIESLVSVFEQADKLIQDLEGVVALRQ